MTGQTLNFNGSIWVFLVQEAGVAYRRVCKRIRVTEVNPGQGKEAERRSNPGALLLKTTEVIAC